MRLCRKHRLADELRIALAGAGSVEFGGRSLRDAAVFAQHGTGGKVELAPPDHVSDITEGTHHRDTRSLVLLGQVVGFHRNLDPEEGGANGLAEEVLVAGVVGVGDQRDTGGNQLGPGGHNGDRLVIGGAVEGDLVVGRGLVAVLQFRLGYRRAERDVPQSGSVRLVGLAAGEIAQKSGLRGALRVVVDGPVGETPVDAESQGAPEVLKLLFVFDGEFFAQLDEVSTTNRNLLLVFRALASLKGGCEALFVGQ